MFEYVSFSISSPMMLKDGDNILPGGKEMLVVQKSLKCYQIVSRSDAFESLNAQSRTLKVEFNSLLTEDQLPARVIFVFTSEDNSYGVESGEFPDGTPFITEILLNHEKTVELKPQQFNFLEEAGDGCSKSTRWEQVALKFSARIPDLCPIPCLPRPLPNISMERCVQLDFTNSGYSLTSEYKCAQSVVVEAMNEVQLETSKTCSKLQYKGKVIKEDQKMEGYQAIVAYTGIFQNDPTVVWHDGKELTKLPTVKLHYTFERPEKTTVAQEYIVVTFEDLISIVGGNLGLFIGFAFSDWIFTMMGYCTFIINKINQHLLKNTDTKKLSKPKSKAHKVAPQKVSEESSTKSKNVASLKNPQIKTESKPPKSNQDPTPSHPDARAHKVAPHRVSEESGTKSNNTVPQKNPQIITE